MRTAGSVRRRAYRGTYPRGGVDGSARPVEGRYGAALVKASRLPSIIWLAPLVVAAVLAFGLGEIVRQERVTFLAQSLALQDGSRLVGVETVARRHDAVEVRLWLTRESRTAPRLHLVPISFAGRPERAPDLSRRALSTHDLSPVTVQVPVPHWIRERGGDYVFRLAGAEPTFGFVRLGRE